LVGKALIEARNVVVDRPVSVDAIADQQQSDGDHISHNLIVDPFEPQNPSHACGAKVAPDDQCARRRCGPFLLWAGIWKRFHMFTTDDPELARSLGRWLELTRGVTWIDFRSIF
jgi:hypothetical protein